MIFIVVCLFLQIGILSFTKEYKYVYLFDMESSSNKQTFNVMEVGFVDLCLTLKPEDIPSLSIDYTTQTINVRRKC